MKTNTLTQRESEIMQLIIKGYHNPEISEKLCISEHTTKAHLASIYKKLNVINRLQATIKCFSLCTRKELSFFHILVTFLKLPHFSGLLLKVFLNHYLQQLPYCADKHCYCNTNQVQD